MIPSIDYTAAIGFSPPAPPAAVPLPTPFVFGSPACRPPLARAAVAVGNFDGVHLGHAAIIRRLVAGAEAVAAPAVALR